MIKLYVDFINADKSFASTSDYESVMYNLIAVDMLHKTDRPVFALGKYVCMAFQGDKPSMTFIDFGRNPDIAKKFVNMPQLGEEVKFKMSLLIEVYNANYDTAEDNIEFVVGEPE